MEFNKERNKKRTTTLWRPTDGESRLPRIRYAQDIGREAGNGTTVAVQRRGASDVGMWWGFDGGHGKGEENHTHGMARRIILFGSLDSKVKNLH